MRFTTTTLAGCFLSLAISSPLSSSNPQAFVSRQIAEIPHVWIENVAVRSNGNLLLTTFDAGRLYSLNPSQHAPPHAVAQIEGVNALLGIAEVDNDVFAVAGANLNPARGEFEAGSTKIVLVNFNGCGKSANDTPSVRTIVKNKDLETVNGITALPRQRHIILGALSVTGEVVRVDTKTGVADIVIRGDELTAGTTGLFPFGINGVKVLDNHLYFTNTGRQTFGRVKIDEFGNKIGNFEIIAREPANSTFSPDDFSLDKKGNAFVCFLPDRLVKITPGGQRSIVANGTLAGPTSSTFSRDGKSLYVVSAGQGLDSVSGGQVVEIKV